MADPERYQSPLTGPEMDQALLDMANHTSERFAKGTANGVAVEAGTDGYNDNSLYYKNQAASQVQLAANQVSQATAQADRAANAADRAEAAVPAGIDSAVLFTRAQTLTAAQQTQARANIMAGGSNPNLLDNPWWGTGVINQRDFTGGDLTGQAYTIDRWKRSGAMNISLASSGITITNSSTTGWRFFVQYIEQSVSDNWTGKTMTMSVLTADDAIYSSTFTIPARTSSSQTVRSLVINQAGTARLEYQRAASRDLVHIALNGAGTSVSIKAVKLELGTVSTLANDAPPNYAEELAKCQSYFIRIKGQENANYPIATGIASGTTTCRFILPTPATLRTNPSAPVVNGSWQVWGNGTYSNISAWGSQPMKAEHGIFFGITSASNLTINQTYQLVNSTAGGYIDFSADL